MNEELLHGTIADDFGKLNEMEVGSEERKAMVDELTKLVDRAIEIDKLNIEHDEKVKSREDERKDRLIKNGLTAAGIIIPSLITIWGTVKSLKFEEEGTVTTILGRGFINKLLPKK